MSGVSFSLSCHRSGGAPVLAYFLGRSAQWQGTILDLPCRRREGQGRQGVLVAVAHARLRWHIPAADRRRGSPGEHLPTRVPLLRVLAPCQTVPPNPGLARVDWPSVNVERRRRAPGSADRKQPPSCHIAPWLTTALRLCAGWDVCNTRSALTTSCPF